MKFFISVLVAALVATASAEPFLQDWITSINSQVQIAVNGAIDKLTDIAAAAGAKGKEGLAKIQEVLKELEKQKDAALAKIQEAASKAEREAAARLTEELEKQIARLKEIRDKLENQLGKQ